MADHYGDERNRYPTDPYPGDRDALPRRGRRHRYERGYEDRYGAPPPGEGEYGYYGHGEYRRSDYTRMRPHGYGDEPGEAIHRGRGPAGYRRSDARITEDVNDLLMDDPYVDASDIAVKVHEGEVTLDGHVETRTQKRLAEDLAHEVVGVHHVQNNLRIHSAAAPVTGTARGDRAIP